MRLTQVQFAEMQRLAEVETEGNVSQMIRKAVDGFLQARSKSAVVEAVASVRAEGLEPSARGHQVLGQVAAGVIAVEEAVEVLVEHHTVETVLPIHAGQDVAQPSNSRSVPVVLPETVPAGYSVEERVVAGLEVDVSAAPKPARAPGKALSKVDAQRAMRERKHG